MAIISSKYSILVILTLINLLNYLDRYILAALLPAIQTDLKLSDAQLGYLGSAFIIMYFLISPLFGWLGDRSPRNYIIAFGVFFWSLATAASGAARSFMSLLLARFGVGIGEAAYGTVTPAILSDLFGKDSRTKVFAWFFMAIPVGSALGYLLGGVLEQAFDWRMAFYIVGVPGILLSLLLIFIKDPERGQTDSVTVDLSRHSQKEAYLHLLQNYNYVFVVLGYTAYTFALGGVAHWMPTYVYREYEIPLARANFIIGAITVAGGFLGTFIGGWWGARWQKRSPDGLLKMSALSLFLAVPVFLVLLNVEQLWLFAVLLFVIELCIFLSTSPINAEIVNTVSPAFRATAGAVCIFTIHILGDAISPSLIGVISGFSSLNTAMYICPVAIFVGGLLWGGKCVFFFSTAEPDADSIAPEPWQAHRGYHDDGAQENSLPAFQAAEKAGFRMVELDVQLSADGVPVVVHDKDLQRVAGVDGKVTGLTASELKARGSVPALAEVFSVFSGKVNIEIKSDVTGGNAELVRAVLQVIEREKVRHRVMFSSFNPFVLRECSRQAPSILRALAVSRVREPGNGFLLRYMLLAWLARPHLLHIDHKMLTPAFARHLKMRRIRFAVWTVNDKKLADECRQRGAFSVITDRNLLKI